MKGANKKIINLVGKQGGLLKEFRDEDEFFDCVNLSRSSIYFKLAYTNFMINTNNPHNKLF